MQDTNLRNIVPTFANQKEYLSEILDSNDFNKLVAIKDELEDTWEKKQIFRTETEMRISVLNDAKFPTRAAKYWQAVREQNAFFENFFTRGHHGCSGGYIILMYNPRLSESLNSAISVTSYSLLLR
jgi:hypothetical protein